MENRYQDNGERLNLARELAAEGIVLLTNEDHVLPLAAGKTVALLGRVQNNTNIGGGGSGFSQCDNPLQVRAELKASGVTLEPALDAFYGEAAKSELSADEERKKQMAEMFSGGLEGLVASGMIYELFGKYNAPKVEPIPSEDIFKEAAGRTDTAIILIGRDSGGEECDRRVENDYYLIPSEEELIEAAAAHFANLIVVFNVNGAVDTGWMLRYPQIKASLFMGTAGEQGAGALADILTGKVSPSGKLTQTLALTYEDYPTAENFCYNKDDVSTIRTYADYGLSAEDNGSTGRDLSPVTLYQEGIYVGYRYFDTYLKDVMFPFGHGLSYASFDLKCVSADLYEGSLCVTVSVENTSDAFSGKETVQLYVSALDGVLDKPLQELKAFAKTDLLAPRESETLVLSVPLQDLASFDEENMCYLIEQGMYIVFLGTGSRDGIAAASLLFEDDIVTRRVSADIGPLACNAGKIDWLTGPDAEDLPEDLWDEEDDADEPEEDTAEEDEEDDDASAFWDGEALPVLAVTQDDLRLCWESEPIYDFSVPAEPSVLRDVYEGRVSMEAFINQMSFDELLVLCTGWGSGLPFGGAAAGNAPVSLQYPDGTDIGTCDREGAMQGYTSPALTKYGIPSAVYKDGPASVGMTAWPTDMVIAQTWNTDLMYRFGSACGWEAASQGVDSWLAPGMDIMRNPICGRNFEYFSEDPYVTGVCAVEITKGAMETNPVTTCPKHFALNEQETYRRGSGKKNIDAADSIVSARAAREIYLKPFEMVVTQAEPTTVMTSFNRINGTFAGGHRALCTDILRGEWGYDGVVVTDWGDMDVVVDGADAVAAGNDVVMPGGPPVMEQIRKGYEEGRVTLEEMKRAAAHLMNFVMNSAAMRNV